VRLPGLRTVPSRLTSSPAWRRMRQKGPLRQQRGGSNAAGPRAHPLVSLGTNQTGWTQCIIDPTHATVRRHPQSSPSRVANV
jgi:hypothetical protein